jgi:hypothetical protein
VSVQGARIDRSHEAGVALWGVSATLQDTVVRDTVPSPGEGVGHGLAALCDPQTQACGELRVTSCLIDRATEVGVLCQGTETTITGTVVRDTRPDAAGESGRGIEVQCDADQQVCGRLELVDALISGSTSLGVYLLGVPGRLTGTTVRDLQPATASGDQPPTGQGVLVRCDPDGGGCGALEMTACVVRATYSAGLSLLGVSGVVRSSEVTQVWPRPADGRFGYGIEVSALPDGAPPVLDVLTCLIQEVDLAGIVFSSAGGSVSGCAIGGGDFSIAMSPDAAPTIAGDNLLEGRVSSPPARVALESSPSPPPSVPR